MTPERLAGIKKMPPMAVVLELIAHIEAQDKRIKELEADKARDRKWLLHFMKFWEFWNQCDSYLGHQTGYNYERAWHDCSNWITADEYKSVNIFEEAKEKLGFDSSPNGLIDNARDQ